MANSDEPMTGLRLLDQFKRSGIVLCISAGCSFPSKDGESSPDTGLLQNPDP